MLNRKSRLLSPATVAKRSSPLSPSRGSVVAPGGPRKRKKKPSPPKPKPGLPRFDLKAGRPWPPKSSTPPKEEGYTASKIPHVPSSGDSPSETVPGTVTTSSGSSGSPATFPSPPEGSNLPEFSFEPILIPDEVATTTPQKAGGGGKVLVVAVAAAIAYMVFKK